MESAVAAVEDASQRLHSAGAGDWSPLADCLATLRDAAGAGDARWLELAADGGGHLLRRLLAACHALLEYGALAPDHVLHGRPSDPLKVSLHRAAQLYHNAVRRSPHALMQHAWPAMRDAAWPLRLVGERTEPKLAGYVAAALCACADVVLCAVRPHGICYDALKLGTYGRACLQFLAGRSAAEIGSSAHEWHCHFVCTLLVTVGVHTDDMAVDMKRALLDVVASNWTLHAASCGGVAQQHYEQGATPPAPSSAFACAPAVHALSQLAEDAQVAPAMLERGAAPPACDTLRCLMGAEKAHRLAGAAVASCGAHRALYESDPRTFYDLMRETIVLAGNLCHNSRAAQLQCGEHWLIPALLDCTAPCHLWPLRPQFAIAALAHACRRCPQNQARLFEVTGAQPAGCIDVSGLLKEMGLEPAVDEITGKLTLARLDG